MILKKPLDTILGQASKVKLLRFMVITNAEMNGTELAKAVGMSHVKCNMALQELSQHGLIILRKLGQSNLYKLQKEHILYTDILGPLFEKEGDLLEVLSDTIINAFKGTKPITLAVFGSNVKGTARPDSDIDVLVIIPNSMVHRVARKLIGNAEEIISGKFGNQLSPIIVTQNQFQQKCKKKEPLYQEILKHNKVIYGKTIAEVL